MTTYSGPATVVFSDGTTRPATVEIALYPEGGLARWGGRITMDDSTRWRAFNEGFILRMPDGREAPAVLGAASGPALAGSGPAPFG